MDGDIVNITKTNLYKLIGLTNNKYKNMPFDVISEIDPEITKFDMSHFYHRTSQRLDSILFTSLDNMSKRMVISYKEIINVVYIDDETGLKVSSVANDMEERWILEINREVLESMGFEYITQVFLSCKSKEYYKKVNALLKKRHGIAYSYKSYKIIYLRNNILNIIPQIGRAHV